MASTSNAPPPVTGPTDYYELLNVDKTADAAALKKDKNGSDPVAVERFQRIAKAYEVLCECHDDVSWSIACEETGERGVTMMETIPFLDPDVLLAINRVILLGVLVCILILLFPIFIALRADGKISWTWTTVFIPAFIALALVLISSLYSLITGDYEEMSETESGHQVGKKTTRALIDNILGNITIALIGVFTILLALQLDGNLSSWGAVFAPWFVVEIILLQWTVRGLLTKFTEGVTVMMEPTEENEEPRTVTTTLSGMQKVMLTITELYLPTLRIVQVALIVVKLSNPTGSMSWAVTFVPCYIWGCMFIIKKLFEYWIVRESDTDGSARSQILCSILAFVVLAGGLFFTFLGLFIHRLEQGSDSPSAAVLLIPAFIVISIVMCFVGVCLPCAVCMTNAQLTSELKTEEAGVATELVVPADRRIESA
ncbi:hypothetical protein HDU76_001819 [Blyttiomyces sp. JEL0837]|nr:hypothetical protein HDU76_001819 [Blyttiomyces sp. JEL0837]